MEKAQERVLQSEENLCYIVSWEPDRRRPNYLSTKIWQIIQSNNTKSENLDGDYTEILEKTFLLGWSEQEIDELLGWRGRGRKFFALVGICWGFSC